MMLPFVVKYDTINYILCAQQQTGSQLHLPHEVTKTRDVQKKRSSHKVRGVSPEAGREFMMGKICQRGRF